MSFPLRNNNYSPTTSTSSSSSTTQEDPHHTENVPEHTQILRRNEEGGSPLPTATHVGRSSTTELRLVGTGKNLRKMWLCGDQGLLLVVLMCSLIYEVCWGGGLCAGAYVWYGLLLCFVGASPSFFRSKWRHLFYMSIVNLTSFFG